MLTIFYNNLMLVQERNYLIDTIIKNIQEQSSENTHSSQQADSSKNSIVLRKVNNRVFKNYHNIKSPSPYDGFISPQHHVYKLFNTFGINQLALTTSDFEESFLRTYFYHRVVTKVEKYQNAVVISIIPLSETVNQPALTYLIDKLKSYGNIELFRLAALIEELWSELVELKNQKMQSIIKEDKQSITKYLNNLGKQMYFCKFGLYKIAISNSLLEYLGYNIDEFCVETIKYRTVLFDIMSSNVYYKTVFHALTTLKHLMAVDLNKLAMQDYISMSRLEFTDYIYSKDHKKTYCDIEFTIPVRGIICFRFKNIHYQSNELGWKPYCSSYEFNSSAKEKINQKEFELLNKLGVIPSNWLNKSKPKVAGYQTIEGHSKLQKMQKTS